MTSPARTSGSATHHAHDDLPTPQEMRADGREAERRLQRAVRTVGRPAPSLEYADYPREVRKPEIEVSEAAARIAAALHLHLD